MGNISKLKKKIVYEQRKTQSAGRRVVQTQRKFAPTQPDRPKPSA